MPGNGMAGIREIMKVSGCGYFTLTAYLFIAIGSTAEGVLLDIKHMNLGLNPRFLFRARIFHYR